MSKLGNILREYNKNVRVFEGINPQIGMLHDLEPATFYDDIKVITNNWDTIEKEVQNVLTPYFSKIGYGSAKMSYISLVNNNFQFFYKIPTNNVFKSIELTNLYTITMNSLSRSGTPFKKSASKPGIYYLILPIYLQIQLNDGKYQEPTEINRIEMDFDAKTFKIIDSNTK